MNKSILLASFLFLSPAYSIAAKSSSQAQVIGDFVGVRNAPNKDGAYVGVLYKNMIVSVIKKSEEKATVGQKMDYWYRVKYKNIDGWCFGGFLDFELKNNEIDTYRAPSDLGWFFNRYGRSTFEYLPKINITSFTLDEYRSLITAVESSNSYEEGNVAATALANTLYRDIKQKEKIDPFPYLHEKIYSNEFLGAMAGYLQYNAGELIPNFPDAYSDDEAFLLAYAKTGVAYPPALQLASERLASDRTFVKKVIEYDGRNLQFAPKFQDDKEIVLLAIKKTPASLVFASRRLKDDRAIILLGLEGKGQFGLRYLPAKYQDDKDLVIKIINRENYFHEAESLSPAMRDDNDVAMLVMSKSPYSYISLSPRQQGKREFALAAVKSSGFLIEKVPEPLRSDEEIVRAAYATALRTPCDMDYNEEDTIKNCGPENEQRFFSLISEEWQAKLRSKSE